MIKTLLLLAALALILGCSEDKKKTTDAATDAKVSDVVVASDTASDVVIVPDVKIVPDTKEAKEASVPDSKTDVLVATDAAKE